MDPKNRQHLRKQATYPVLFTLPDGSRRPGICSNISLGGLRIDTPDPMPFGSTLTVLIELDDQDGGTSLPGIVRWTTPGSMGIQLGLLSARATYALLRILENG